MRSLWGPVLLLALLAVDANAADEYVLQGRRILCTTPRSLQEALHAIEYKDRNLMMTVQGCRYSAEGVPVELVQDNINMIKIRIIGDQEEHFKEFWTLPDSIKRANGR